jgi:ParB family chromosome partitioning protein
MQQKQNIQEIPISKLFVSSLNVRKDLISDQEESTIQDLAENIKKNGLLSPICVRKKGDLFEIFAGQRRFLAIRTLSWDSIPAIVFDESISDDDIKNLSFAENIQRNNMSQKDKIDYYFSLYIKYGSVSEVSKIVNVSERVVQNYLKIKNNLSENLYNHIKDEKNNLSINIASSLSSFDKKQQENIAQAVSKLDSSKEKLDYIRNLINDSKVKKKKFKIQSDPSVILPPSNIDPLVLPSPASDELPWVFDRNNKKLIIPQALYIEISDLVNDYKYENFIDD